MQFQLVEQELQFLLRLGETAENDLSIIRGGQVNINHLDRAKFIQDRTWCQTGSQIAQPAPQRRVQAVGQKGHENMRFNASLFLMEKRAQCQIALEVLKRLLDLRKLDIEVPQLRRLLLGQVGAQQVAAFASPHLPKLFLLQAKLETGL